MLYRVEFTKSARKEFDGLPKTVQDRVIDASHLLAQNPYTELLKIRKIRGGEHLYRVRLGDYRLLYEIRKEVLLILVIKIGHRSGVYRFLK
ncbi:MAG: type II toxin-antitoxin system RelE/ParE family toxin [Pseudomonadota bacterium]